MARIAIGGFQHETNCFVEPRTDFAYFAAHVDRIETGRSAAKAMELLLLRGRPAGRALRKAPFLIPLNGQCTLVEPSKSVVAR